MVPSPVGWKVKWCHHWWAGCLRAGRWGGSLTSGLGGRGITLIGGLEVGWLSYWWTRGGMQEDFLPIAKR